ncbi:MAG: hypothetical protein VR70_05535 [Rhodospirillaceae bacterium BRH_c57]|nr:MAG: hypothetical protein VR70_05535 [Rhodospirillaceae bacterium BRH_c57]
MTLWNILAPKAVAGLALGLALAAPAVQAADLPPGTVIEAANLQSVLGDTFDGHAVADLLPDPLRQQIATKGLRITLKGHQPWKVDARYRKWTDGNRGGTVDIAPDGKGLKGWQAGAPFPDIDPADPQAGTKAVWNLLVGQPLGCYWSQPRYTFVTVDAQRAIEREMLWRFSRLNMVGRYCDPDGKLTLGDGQMRNKQLLVALEPFDMRGTGMLSNSYMNGDVPRNWAYVRSVRRVRTLSGSSWMDPVGGGTDLLNDDVDTFNAHPTWYKSLAYKGKRWVLAPANVTETLWVADAGSQQARYPKMNLSASPHWNLDLAYEPREVHVVEAVPPDEHPYGKKVLYIDAQYPMPRYVEVYDKTGAFWKLGTWVSNNPVDAEGNPVVATYAGTMVDMKRDHATHFLSTPNPIYNDPSVGENELSVGILERLGS